MELVVEIQNESNHVLQDFDHELVWKPNNRVRLINENAITKSRDLHERLETAYFFTIQDEGSLRFSCRSTFANPLFPDKTIRRTTLLQKMNLSS